MTRRPIAVALLFCVLTGCGKEAADYRRGLTAFANHDYDTAYRYLLTSARQGHPAAQFRIAVMHSYGVGVPPNPSVAANWYRQAARQGDMAAQYQLASMYLSGKGVRRDPKMAFRWFHELARTGYAPAQYRVGKMFEAGEGVAVDAEEAARWMSLAAQQR